MRILYDEFTFLLPGKTESATEFSILRQIEPLNANF